MVVPTLALVDEYKQKIIRHYKNKFKNYNIYLSIDQDKQYDLTQKNIFVVTHDRVIDDKTISLFKSIDFLVIDEVYKLQKDPSNERVLILNIAYYNMVRLSRKYVLLAPFISGVENLERLDDVPAFYATNFSPVVNDVITYDILSEDERTIYADKILKTIPIEDNTLIYFPKVVSIDNYINNTTTSFSALHIEENPILSSFIEWGKHEIHPDWSVIKGLEKGFLIHHGQLPLGIRMLQLELFNNTESNYSRLLCTSTLLEGVNTTAKHIIITKPSRYQSNFDAFDFYNLVGRTGRLYQHYLGVAHYIKGPRDPIYEKNQALKSIQFELTDNSIDMDINFGDYKSHPEFIRLLDRLGMSYEQYKEQIARKHRFTTVQFLLKQYEQHKQELLSELYNLTVNTGLSKINLIRVIEKIINKTGYNFKLRTFIINRLTYKYRQSVRDVVEATIRAFKNCDIPSVINSTIRLKNNYVEYEFYSKAELT